MERILSSTPVRVLLGFLLVALFSGIAPPYFPYSVELSSEGVTNSLRKTSSFERLHGKMCLTRTFLRSYSMNVEMTAWNFEMEGDTWVYKRRGTGTKSIAEPEYIEANFGMKFFPRSL
jgi:hypothetical protein